MPKHSPRYQPLNPKLINVLVPEKVLLDTWYTCTINLADTYDDINQTIQAYRYFLYKYIKPYVWFKFNPEISKLGRFHLHGRIMFNEQIDIVLFYMNLKYISKEAAMEIDEIKDEKIWEDYCIKQKHIMGPYMLSIKKDYELTHENIKRETSVHLRDIFTESIEDYEMKSQSQLD